MFCRKRLEAWAWETIQGFLQAPSVDEVSKPLGRRELERRVTMDARPGYPTGDPEGRPTPSLPATPPEYCVHYPRQLPNMNRQDAKVAKEA